MSLNKVHKNPFNVIVIVAALGYFVDIYDLILFSIVRVPSLKSLGLSREEIMNVGISLMNWQMTGMLLGGLLWGILGDKKGRVSVLFGSIIMYSAANFLNGFVTDVNQYEWLRLIAGIGLAGELGAGITLVNETMSKENRGYGATIVVTVGIGGALLVGYVGANYEWNTAYFIGGGLGLLLLFLRLGVYESGMYQSVATKAVSKGNFFYLFSSRERFIRYISCIALGLPVWYVIGILMFFIPELSIKMGVIGTASAGTGILCCYSGHILGDFCCGLFSQYFKTRRKVVLVYLIFTSICIPIYLLQQNITTRTLYMLCVILGVSSGFWVGFMSIASEQFGTNIRATVTTTVPNFVRGALVLMMLLLNFLREDIDLPIITSMLIVGVVVMTLSIVSLFGLKETFGKDLNYIEGETI